MNTFIKVPSEKNFNNNSFSLRIKLFFLLYEKFTKLLFLFFLYSSRCLIFFKFKIFTLPKEGTIKVFIIIIKIYILKIKLIIKKFILFIIFI